MGIISFQGARSKTKKQDETPIQVSDYMTRDLITFRPNQPVIEM